MTTTKTDAQTVHCPFCGSPPLIETGLVHGDSYSCSSDRCFMMTIGLPKEVWNTRVPAAQRLVDGWLPIETFNPEGDDSETILLSNGKKVVAGYWRQEELMAFYYHDYPDDYNLYSIKPTHWMPMPKPPTTSEEV